MNAPNIKRSIVSNALRPVISARKNAGTWQRNNPYLPLPAMEQSTEMTMPKSIEKKDAALNYPE
jgi:hypothetical protein